MKCIHVFTINRNWNVPSITIHDSKELEPTPVSIHSRMGENMTKPHREEDSHPYMSKRNQTQKSIRVWFHL